MHPPIGRVQFAVFEKFTSAYLSQIAREKSCDYLLIIFMKKLRENNMGKSRTKTIYSNSANTITHSFKTRSKPKQRTGSSMFYKFFSRNIWLNGQMNCLNKRFWVLPLPDRCFLLLILLVELCLSAFNSTANQMKLFRFLFQHLLGRNNPLSRIIENQ